MYVVDSTALYVDASLGLKGLPESNTLAYLTGTSH
jgi:hypothetical protein